MATKKGKKKNKGKKTGKVIMGKGKKVCEFC